MEPKSSRVTLLANQLAGAKEVKPVLSSLDFCFFDDLLTEEEAKFRKEVREFADNEITPYINEYYEKAEFPEPIVKKLGEKNWFKKFLIKPYGEGKSVMSLALMFMEIARADASMVTICFPIVGTAIYILQHCATEEQKARLLPDIITFKKLAGFGLTEMNVGSDAINIETTFKKVPGGYVLNGNKRWPGNAHKDIVIIWAKNEENKKLEAFIVEHPTPGVKVELIKHKLAMRCVQNSIITIENAFIKEEDKLPELDNPFLMIGMGLASSRVLASWAAVGIAVGVYDHTIKYVNNRTQFGAKISSFQLSQEKLSRMMGHIQAMLLMTWRVTRIMEDGKMTGGMASMAKAWTTSLCREVTRLGRELHGGNGIIIDNYVMKALADIEGLLTYEGTYEINSLFLGRELTGINAFKAGK